MEESASDLLVRPRGTSYCRMGPPEDLMARVDPCLPFIGFSGSLTTCLSCMSTMIVSLAGQIRGGGPKWFHDSFNFVFYIVGECISCAADTHLATDLTC